MTATATSGPASLAEDRPALLRRCGVVTVASGALGVACAAGILLTPPMVPSTRFSHPFDSTWFVVTQVLFAVQHLAMLAGVVGLLALAPSRARVLRAGLVTAAVALLLLVGCELVALLATEVDEGSRTADAVATAYTAPTLLAGLGFLLAGWSVGRRRLLPWGRWIPFAFGAWVFVVLLPALGGTAVAGRLALGGWLALYALLGVGLLRAARGHGPSGG